MFPATFHDYVVFGNPAYHAFLTFSSLEANTNVPFTLRDFTFSLLGSRERCTEVRRIPTGWMYGKLHNSYPEQRHNTFNCLRILARTTKKKPVETSRQDFEFSASQLPSRSGWKTRQTTSFSGSHKLTHFLLSEAICFVYLS